MKKIIINTAKIILVVLVALLVFINLTPLRFFFPQTYPHEWCSDGGKFWTMERGKGHDPYGSVIASFEAYKKEVNKPALVLHRRFYRKWWQVWNWYDFLTYPHWKHPYAESNEAS